MQGGQDGRRCGEEGGKGPECGGANCVEGKNTGGIGGKGVLELRLGWDGRRTGQLGLLIIELMDKHVRK